MRLVSFPSLSSSPEFDLPLLVNGEPQTRLSSPLSPRGRRPSCSSAFGCTRLPPRYRLDEFPPAQPNISNIGNICNEGRKKLYYGPWNVPQTGFGHLSRQGDALNNMESGVGQCCKLPDGEKLPCCQSVVSCYCCCSWSDKNDIAVITGAFFLGTLQSRSCNS